MKKIDDFGYNIRTSICVFGVDLELAVGMAHRKRSLPERFGEKIRVVFSRISRLFEDFKIPVTFFISGHLFLGSRIGKHNNKLSGPRARFSEDLNWFAPDLINEIQSSDVNHEIATHGFLHLDYGKASVQNQREDLKETLKAMEGWGIRPFSMAFPWNSKTNLSLNLLREFGIAAYREGGEGKISLPSEVLPGLWAIPGSIWLRPVIHLPVFNECLEYVIKHGGIFHPWTHLHDWIEDADSLERVFRPCLERIIYYRENRGLKLITMRKAVDLFRRDTGVLKRASFEYVSESRDKKEFIKTFYDDRWLVFRGLRRYKVPVVVVFNESSKELKNLRVEIDLPPHHELVLQLLRFLGARLSSAGETFQYDVERSKLVFNLDTIHPTFKQIGLKLF